MRRLEDGVRDAPPFRILSDVGGPVYAVPAPPSALAPEPYKMTPSSSAANRTRRKSSFVIIAEARPATPTSRSPSPYLASGRASPFRGRGFKGPPPRAQSRPQTPEAKDIGRVTRTDRRMSTSQQNSPKRSLIPQPARRRSVSLSKTETGRESPKYGRRATSKNRLEVTHVQPGQRASLKVPGLSPIQGTPTKPPEKKPGQYLLTKKSSTVKSIRGNLTVPSPKIGGRLNPILKTKSPTKPTNLKPQDQPNSPSKIPVKKGSIPDVKVQFSHQSSRRGSLAKPRGKNEKLVNEVTDQKDQKIGSKSAAGSNGSPPNQQQNTLKKTDPRIPQLTSSKEAQNDSIVDEKVASNKTTDHQADEPTSLMDLLKQSSGASGTSSVVNTTTVTAAQPLQIDAIALVDSEAHNPRENEVEVKLRNPDSGRRTEAARPTGISIPSDLLFSPKMEDSVASETNAPEPISSAVKHHHGRAESDGTQGTISSEKSNPTNVGRPSTNGQPVASSNASGRAIANGMTASQNMDTESNGQSTITMHGFQPVVGGQLEANADALNHRTHGMTNEKYSTVIDSAAKHSDVHHMSIKNSGGIGTPKSIGRSINSGRIVKPVSIVQASSDRSYNSSGLVGSLKRLESDQHMGSGASLKSSTGLSTGSTDTGVSVDTVHGVSSAREKRGMHIMKQSQGIETLSGNVVRNGEAVVLGAQPRDHNGEVQDQDLVGETVDSQKSRWKKIWNRCCGCCKCNCSCVNHGRIMRCLACRRGLKPHRSEPQTINQAAPKETPGCFSRLKLSNRSCRLPNWKGCSRGSRVAPAEDGRCCPPERRCGSVLLRLCRSCTCRRQDAPQQMMNVQAKQSLTSIAAPVLPEEPKSKIPEVLVEHNAPMRGAIPCLPIPLAWFCLIWNILIPGTGTFWSGLFNLCVGQPRYSAVATPRARIGAFLVNTIVAVGQMFTVLFCLVGWGWSIWWGVIMVRLARKYKRFKDSEAANNDVEARVGDGESTSVPPGVPDQALRGYERAR